VSEQIELTDERDRAFDEFAWPWEKRNQCSCCEAKATRKTPVIDQPSVDKLPIVYWLRNLYNAPPRFTVKERGQKTLCDLHFGLSEQLARNKVADLRHSQAKLNGREFLKVHAFNQTIIDETKNAERLALQ
jgi:hypothetical protein